MTFEPDPRSASRHPPSSSAPPALRGVRSRVVNGKRSDLSKGIRRKAARDNRELMGPSGNLRGWNDKSRKKLVRGFFGHTRFATTSKATLDGTHPHRWCERRVHDVYSFASPSASSAQVAPPSAGPRSVGVENYVTHNGDFEFYTVNGKCYDLEVVQRWLEQVLGTPMPATVDSGEHCPRPGPWSPLNYTTCVRTICLNRTFHVPRVLFCSCDCRSN